MKIVYEGWLAYGRQEILCLAGISSAVIHLSVLDGDGTTLAYARTQQFSPLAISLVGGFAAFFGVLGTFIFPMLH